MSTYEDFRKQICAGIHMGLSTAFRGGQPISAVSITALLQIPILKSC